MSDLVIHGAVPLVAPPPRRRTVDRRAGAQLAVLLTTLAIWIDRHRQRRALADLAERDDYLLADIGRTRAEARKEAARAFWVTTDRIFLM